MWGGEMEVPRVKWPSVLIVDTLCNFSVHICLYVCSL
jgi:hypothetical protein